MSGSPKRWYWGGGSSSPAPSPRGTHDEVALSQEESEALLEQLDEQWFCDNVVRWPTSRPGSPPGVIDKQVASPFSRRDVRTATAHLNPVAARSRAETTRRASDGDHLLRRYLERDQHQRAASRFATSFSPLEPLTGVTEDEEMESDLFAKMVANRPAKLTTINPGRDPLQQSNRLSSTTGSLPAKKLLHHRQRRRLKGTKSLTDLEYEELRGLKDLGFEVSKDDLTPHVVRMFPGLQRQGIPPYTHPATSQDHVKVRMFPGAQQPLLLWPRRPDSPLLNAPALDPSIDMKGQLKSWASEMASIVSIEC